MACGQASSGRNAFSLNALCVHSTLIWIFQYSEKLRVLPNILPDERDADGAQDGFVSLDAASFVYGADHHLCCCWAAHAQLDFVIDCGGADDCSFDVSHPRGGDCADTVGR